MGLSCKIDSVFSKQKTVIRAGFVNFKYRDGIIPTHTKSSFNSMKVLTNFLAKNVHVSLHKIRIISKFTSKSERISVRKAIPNNAHNQVRKSTLLG